MVIHGDLLLEAWMDPGNPGNPGNPVNEWRDLTTILDTATPCDLS